MWNNHTPASASMGERHGSDRGAAVRGEAPEGGTARREGTHRGGTLTASSGRYTGIPESEGAFTLNVRVKEPALVSRTLLAAMYLGSGEICHGVETREFNLGQVSKNGH